MEEARQANALKQYKLIYSTVLTREVLVETLIPDYMPDAERILSADAKLCIRSKNISAGSVALEGSITGWVLYAGEGESEPQKLELSAGVSMESPCEGAEDTDKLYVSCRVNYAEAKALNPRKISFRAEAAASIYVFREELLDLQCDMTQAGDAEILESSIEMGCISGVEERTFTISEELPLSDGNKTIANLLHYDTGVEMEDLRKVGGKMILQGNAQIHVLFADEEGRICSDRFRIPFSQIADAPEEEISTYLISVYPMECTVEPYAGLNGAKSFETELRLTAQFLTAAKVDLTYAADAYSLHHPCLAESGQTEQTTPYRIRSLKRQIMENVNLTEPAGEILYARAACSVPFFSGGRARVPVSCMIVYKTQDGNIGTVSKRWQAELSADADDMPGACFGEASCTEPTVTAAGDRLDIRFEVSLPILSAEALTVQYLVSVETDTDTVLSGDGRPSLVAVRPQGRSLWDLAKEYSSTRELIAAANPGPPEENQILLIPRAR